MSTSATSDALDELLPPLDHNSAGANLRDDPLEIEINDALAEFRDQLTRREAEVARARVTNDDEAGRATALAGILADIASGAEKKRVELKEPYLRSSRKIDGDFGGFVQRVKDAKARVVALIDGYRAEQRRIAEEQRRRLEREAFEKEEAARAAAQDGNELAAARLETQAQDAAQAAQTVTAPGIIKSAYGQTASARKEWKFEVTDRAKLPAHVLAHPKVLEAINGVIGGMVRTGARDIPGVRVWSEEKTVIRR